MKPWLMPAIQFVHMYVQRWLALITSDVRLTGLLHFAKRNGAKRNETKWKSLVCEMKICSLRNDNLLSRCVYSDILSRKFTSKKPFRPENSDCAECVTFSLPRIKFNLSSGVSNRKQDLFPFYMPWRHHICIDKCHYSYRDDLPENLPKNHCPRMQKVHFRWPLKRLILTRNVTRYSNEPIKYIIVALLFTFEHGGFNVLYR